MQHNMHTVHDAMPFLPRHTRTHYTDQDQRIHHQGIHARIFEISSDSFTTTTILFMLPPLSSNKRNLKNGNRDKNTLEAWEVHRLCGDDCYQHCSTVQITIMHIIKMNKKIIPQYITKMQVSHRFSLHHPTHLNQITIK